MKKHRFEAHEFALMERSPIPLAVYQLVDRRVATLVLSDGFCELIGYDREEARALMDNDMYRDTHPDDAARVADAGFRFATEGGSYDIVYRSRIKGAYRILHAFGKHVFTEAGARLAVVWYVDEGAYDERAGSLTGGMDREYSRALAGETMVHKSYYDHLTGLPNMSYFFELADADRQRLRIAGRTPAFVYLNLNGMKFYNRDRGFSEGNALLREVARVLARQFGNERCSRFAQDHFALCADAEGLEERLRAVFEGVERAQGGVSLTVRAGIYLDAAEALDVSTACDRAKFACDRYRDTLISGFSYFDETMLASTQNRHYIVNNLDRALAEKWVKVYYQPIVRATNGKVCDEEALARWLDPARGMLSPAEFIPVLEATRLIYKLDLYVLDEILEKLKVQRAAGLYVVPQSLNLSRADFDHPDIVGEICRRVDAAGIAREMITIEITESTVGSDFDFMKAQIERFRALGFQVWMDDFGSGYSSLDVLQNIHFDLIKFDMRFMQRFDQGDESKIILTELMKMAIGLGIDTVAEGVETREQVNFLREVGCTKLQGFYYCRAIPMEEIVERNRKGIQIGFENPDEADYYAAIGGINLYDLAVLAHDSQQDLQRYFNTIPMAIVEVSGDEYTVPRCNQAYRDYIERTFGIVMSGTNAALPVPREGAGLAFVDTLRQCAEDGGTVMIDNDIGNGETTHALIKRIAVNPVRGTAAMVVAILAVVDTRNRNTPISYAHIAKALSSDYRSLYYVNLDTEDFVEYSSGAGQGNLALERHGTDFFQASRDDALRFLYKDDQEEFIKAFTKENVVRNMDEHESFTITYRLIIDGEPRYVSMKAVRMGDSDRHIIVGVNDVDAQMKQQEALEKIKLEQMAYSMVTALSDEYIVIYMVDPATERYTEYSATRGYEGLGLAKGGENFFETALAESVRTICPEDREAFAAAFTRENVLGEIRRNRAFDLRYRLMMADGLTSVNLRAVMTAVGEGEQLIIGVSNVEAKKDR